MSPEVTILAGPARCGKTVRLVQLYAEFLASHRPGSGVWLAPNFRAAQEVTDQVLRQVGRGLLAPHVLTFDQLARLVLRSTRYPRRPVTNSYKRHLLREIVAKLCREGRLQHYGSAGEYPGILCYFERAIGELKRREIWPEELRAGLATPETHNKHRELCLVYQQYQQQLAEHNLYDAEGQLWLARTAMRQGQLGPFERLELVVADGFADFTRTQHDILEVLAKRAGTMLMGLTAEMDSLREELFHRPRVTLRALRSRHPEARVARPPVPHESGWSAMDAIARALFAPPGTVAPCHDTRGIQIVAAASVHRELRWLARRIKQLLLDGDESASSVVRPEDIVVVFRSLSGTAELVRQIFTEYGLPVSLEERRLLCQSASVRTLLAVLSVVVDDWPFRGIMSLLCSSLIRPRWPVWRSDALAAARRTIGSLQLPHGRGALLAAVEEWAGLAAPRAGGTRHETLETADPVDESLDRLWQERTSCARLALPLLRQMARVMDQLPDTADPMEWAVALRSLAHTLGLLDETQQPHAGPEDSIEGRAAVEQLLDSLQSLGRLHEWIDEPAPRWDRRTLASRLRDLARSEPLVGPAEETGRVRVLAAPSTRGMEIPYLFVAGLCEQQFPRVAADDVGFAEAEASALASRGLPMQSRSEHARDEMLLFYETVTRARRSLTLSYAALDESAQPNLPSPYLQDIELVFAPGTIQRCEDEDVRPVDWAEPPMSLGELRLHAVRKAVHEGDPRPLRSLARHPATADVADNVTAALDSIRSRGNWETFGAFEGIMDGEALGDALLRRFGPNHAWSPSRLEMYRQCPFRFFAKEVLSLRTSHGLALEFDLLARGSLLHETMALFHRRLHTLGLPPQHTPDDVLRSTYEEAADEALARLPLGRAHDALQRAVDRRLLTRYGDRYLKQYKDYLQLHDAMEEPFTPAEFEVAFGPRGGEETNPGAILQGKKDGERIVVAGRIDRIDFGRRDGQPVFFIVDYKSGAGTTIAQEIEQGRRLQLPLYAAAVEQMFAPDGRAAFGGAGYWFLGGRGLISSNVLQAGSDVERGRKSRWGSWEHERERAVRTAIAIARAVQTGLFPVFSMDDACTGQCPFATICRIQHIRAIGKTWRGPMSEVEECIQVSRRRR